MAAPAGGGPRHIVMAWALVAAALAGCAGHSPAPAPIAAVPCAVSGVGSPEHPWRAVRGAGFTFCVPGDWRPGGASYRGADASSWYGDGGSITWQLGPPSAIITGERIERVPVGELHDRMAALSRCSGPQSSSEEIGGWEAVLSSTACGMRVRTAAVWARPAMNFQGDARHAGAAQVQWAVYRTVRFSQPGH